jgi:general secretion pathway protein C
MVQTVPLAQTAYPGDSAGGMSSSVASRWWPVLAAAVLWLAVGLSAGYWVLLAWGRTPMVPVAASPADAGALDTALVARALGAAAATPADEAAPSAAASRYALLGVIAGRSSRGAALISVDEQPARPYPVGATVPGGLVLQSVGRGIARLGPSPSGPATVELKLPEPPAGVAQ